MRQLHPVSKNASKNFGTGNYNIINYVSEFEEGVMDHYYEELFDKKDASIFRLKPRMRMPTS